MCFFSLSVSEMIKTLKVWIMWLLSFCLREYQNIRCTVLWVLCFFCLGKAQNQCGQDRCVLFLSLPANDQNFNYQTICGFSLSPSRFLKRLGLVSLMPWEGSKDDMSESCLLSFSLSAHDQNHNDTTSCGFSLSVFKKISTNHACLLSAVAEGSKGGSEYPMFSLSAASKSSNGESVRGCPLSVFLSKNH